MLKRIDLYIIRKFLGTFFLSIALILSIAIVLDVTEKMDRFVKYEASLHDIIFKYYLNFIPFYGNLFSPIFVFIAVIFVTSKLAGNSEIIAIQASGISYNRFLRPYFISAAIIAGCSFYLSGYIIPSANKVRLDFEDQFIRKFKTENVHNVQVKLSKDVVLYIQRYEEDIKTGYSVSIEHFNGKKLVSRLTAERMVWDTLYNWKVEDYLIRRFNGMRESIELGTAKDTVFEIEPKDFFVSAMECPQMSNAELASYLSRQKQRGVGNIKAFEDEYHKRFSMPFAAFVLTLIGVALSSRKVRGGTGANLGIGLLLSFMYVLFSSITTSLSVQGDTPAALAAWLPNIGYTVIGIYLYNRARK